MNLYTFLIFIFNCFNILWFQIGVVEGIVGGEDAHPGQFKFQVAIFNNDVYICVGNILTSKHVLTAAKCVLKANNEFIDGSISVIGDVYKFKKNEYYRITSEVISIYVPILQRFAAHNILTGKVAILKLITALNLGSDTLKMSRLTSHAMARGVKSIDNSEALVAGYGYDTVTESVGPTGQKQITYESKSIKLRFLKVSIVPSEYCQRRYFADPNIYICAQALQRRRNISKGTCKGDEGSALAVDNEVVVGILTDPPTNCNEDQNVGFYAKIDPYLGFIGNVLLHKRSGDIHMKEIPQTSRRTNPMLNGQLPKLIHSY